MLLSYWIARLLLARFFKWKWVTIFVKQTSVLMYWLEKVQLEIRISGKARIWVERGGGWGGNLYMIHALTHIMWIYNIWDQFKKLKAIHFNTKAVFVLASNYFWKCFSVKLECLVKPVNSVNWNAFPLWL